MCWEVGIQPGEEKALLLGDLFAAFHSSKGVYRKAGGDFLAGPAPTGPGEIVLN